MSTQKLKDFKGYVVFVSSEGTFSARSKEGHRELEASTLKELEKSITKTIKAKKLPPVPVIYNYYKKLRETTITSIGQERGSYASKDMKPRIKTEGGGTQLVPWNSLYELTPHNKKILKETNTIESKINELTKEKERLVSNLEKRFSSIRYEELLKTS